MTICSKTGWTLIYGVDVDISDAHKLRRAKLILLLLPDVNTARAAMTPPKPVVKIDVPDGTPGVAGTSIGVAELTTLIATCEGLLAILDVKQKDVSAAKSALRAASRQLDRANKRWYLAWLKAFPEGTPEGDAALSGITTEQGRPPLRRWKSARPRCSPGTW